MTIDRNDSKPAESTRAAGLDALDCAVACWYLKQFDNAASFAARAVVTLTESPNSTAEDCICARAWFVELTNDEVFLEAELKKLIPLLHHVAKLHNKPAVEIVTLHGRYPMPPHFIGMAARHAAIHGEAGMQKQFASAQQADDFQRFEAYAVSVDRWIDGDLQTLNIPGKLIVSADRAA